MSAIVTDPPVQVGTDPQFRQPGGTNFSGINPFMFEVGTNLYQSLAAVQVGEKLLGMFKRAISDTGGSWTLLDSAHSPDQNNISGSAQSLYNSTTGKIAVLYILSDNSGVKICEFDTATDTWGTPSAKLSYTVFGTQFAFCVRSDGTYVVIGTTTSGHLFYATYNGSWSSVNTLLSSPVQVFGGIIDSSNTIHFLLNQTGFQLHYRQLSSSYVLGAATQISASIPFNEGGIPTLCFWGSNSIAVGHIHNSEVHVSIGTPLSAPVFTNYTVYTATSTPSYSTVAVDLSGFLNVFFILYDANADPVVDQIDYSTFDGTSSWSSPTLYYDETTNPPNNAPPLAIDEFLHTLDPIDTTGGWIVATTMETLVGGQDYCTGFFLEQGCPPETGTPGSLPAYTAPNPPGSCIPWTPTTPRASFVFYDMPLEKQGS